MFGGSVQTTSDNETVVAGYREERSTVLGTPITDRAVSASVSTGALTLMGSYGARAAADDVPAPAPGYTRLSIRAGEAKHVEVAGDWSGWRPVSATRATNGVWYVDLRIAPGRYRYAFRVDGSAWRVPDGAAAVDDGFGGKSAWLSVSASPGATGQH